MLFPDHELVLIYDEHGSLNSTSISVDLDFPLFNISHDRVLLRKGVLSPGLSDIFKELTGDRVVTDPLAVQENFIGVGILIISIFIKWLDTEIVKKLQKLRRLLTD